MRAGLYLRVSTDDQTTENQQRELEVAAARTGWQVVATFEDAAQNGMVQLIESGPLVPAIGAADAQWPTALLLAAQKLS